MLREDGTDPMKIAVCVKVVPASIFKPKLEPDTLRLDRRSVSAINAADRHALEEAVRLREALEVGEVVVVSMAPAQAAKPLRETLALGADRVVAITDDAAAGSDLLATSRVLATLLAREAADLVLFGQQAEDAEGALLWAAIADRLQLPALSKAGRLEVRDSIVMVKRQTESGHEILEAPLPCLVSVSRSINEPRYPSVRNMLAAAKRPMELLTLSAIGLSAADAGEAGSATRIYAATTPPRRRETRVVKDTGDGASAIRDYLAAERLIP